ncbi:hypothetical protein CNF00800 [Cryptococcus deneoformans JEC21]|uniref:Uncharacterized protein n=1 Tax=Cryptococcus deneoformans (strain JEC21 / ATCC MYA-565) TaxID=214684 RepID=Q5KFR8_CRYD1|nr:hypothetical protein CNF00800 [Cryptococcus neoformans var. neoformans JEC21]AAW44223.1 hypothetical protein CNF00800 [Cryptococcus neoformans var. neoformans JEC21]
MKYALFALALAGAVSAQSNSTANSTESILIPANITSSCSSFLSELNSDSTLSSCVTPLINATASFSPTAVASANLTEDTINYTLASICKGTGGCDDSTIRKWLGKFYSECYAELTSSTGYNSEVRELYDILYVVNPLKAAVCAVDSSNQEYCVNEIVQSESISTSNSTASNSTAADDASASTNATALFASFAAADSALSPVEVAVSNLYIEVSSAASSLKKRFLDTVLSRRAAQSVNMATIITPNVTTYKNTNLPFLFLQSSMDSSALCTPCTREVMVAYIKWETQMPYALGLRQSPILGGQSALWSAINSTCGTAYVNAITSEVGSTLSSSNGSSSGAESLFVGQGGLSGLTAIVGATVVAGVMGLLI